MYPVVLSNADSFEVSGLLSVKMRKSVNMKQ